MGRLRYVSFTQSKISGFAFPVTCASRLMNIGFCLSTKDFTLTLRPQVAACSEQTGLPQLLQTWQINELLFPHNMHGARQHSFQIRRSRFAPWWVITWIQHSTKVFEKYQRTPTCRAFASLNKGALLRWGDQSASFQKDWIASICSVNRLHHQVHHSTTKEYLPKKLWTLHKRNRSTFSSKLLLSKTKTSSRPWSNNLWSWI